jgi:hypothetical protein
MHSADSTGATCRWAAEECSDMFELTFQTHQRTALEIPPNFLKYFQAEAAARRLTS